LTSAVLRHHGWDPACRWKPLKLRIAVVQLNHDGKTEHITTDKVIIVNAGEVHSADGFGAPSLRFRMVYIPESSFREVASLRTKLSGSPRFSQTALSDRFGLPPHAYQLQQRILRAKHLLTSFSPSHVALECGFSDQSHFTRVFRAHTGTTPRHYAKQFRPSHGNIVVRKLHE